MKRIVILGAGISGLSLGWFLKRRFGKRISLHILEKSDRPGGWIQTVNKDGFLFEQGPRSCRTKGAGAHTLSLIQQLEMEDEVVIADPSAHYRYLYIGSRLRRLPTGPASCALSPLMWRLFPALFRDLFARTSSTEDESIDEFVKRRFGKYAAETFVDPLTSGIYAGDIRKLSVQSCFPQLHEWEKTSGSVIKGALRSKRGRPHTSNAFVRELQKVSLISLKGGMEELTDELAARLDNHIIYSSEVKALHALPYGGAVELENGTSFEADHLFSTLPAQSLAALFGNVHREMSGHLQGIPTASVAVVNIGYHSKQLKKKGFGYLVPSREEEDILGVVWDSCVFPKQNQIPEETRLTVMIGGSRMPRFEEFSEEDFVETARKAVSRHLHIDAEPNAVAVKIARHAIPQYLVGHAARVASLKAILARIFPRLTLHGSSFHGVSVNDCIANSKQLEESLVL